MAKPSQPRLRALVQLAALVGSLADQPLLPGPPPTAGHEVNGFVLLERVASLPGTLALTGSVHPAESEEALVLRSAIERVIGGPPASDTSFPLQLIHPPGSTPAAALVESLGGGTSGLPALPDPYETELLSEARAYRLHRRVNRGAHGEVWRAVRSDDPQATRLDTLPDHPPRPPVAL